MDGLASSAKKDSPGAPECARAAAPPPPDAALLQNSRKRKKAPVSALSPPALAPAPAAPPSEESCESPPARRRRRPPARPHSLRWTVTHPCGTEFYYLRVKLVFDKPLRSPLTDLQVRLHIAAACSQLYGIAGSAAYVDVLGVTYPGPDAVALLRTLAKQVDLVCSALAVYASPRPGELDSSIGGHDPDSLCRFEVVQRSDLLMALASDSRSWSAKLIAGQ